LQLWARELHLAFQSQAVEAVQSMLRIHSSEVKAIIPWQSIRL
jgi:hypothetical protein